MIAQANEEIRSQLLAADQRRRERARLQRPFVYLDWTISRLEAFHLEGKKRVPRRFVRNLELVEELLPDGVRPPDLWKTLIRDVIEQCFALQEQLLRDRNPGYAALQDLESVGDSYLIGHPVPSRPEEAPAVA